MFFSLRPVEDHPCCTMQDVVESFFSRSIDGQVFSLDLFPEWIQSTLGNLNSTLANKFAAVHKLLHSVGVGPVARRAIFDELQLTNRVEELCNGAAQLPQSVIDWNSELGKAVNDLMLALYASLDLAIFRKEGETRKPTHQLYSEFITKNKYVCPFCGLSRFKNKLGPRREDFDHYLHKSAYPLAAANLKNLVPTCAACNQDHKKTSDILADGAAFYPYSDSIPAVTVEVDCTAYPRKSDTQDPGQWAVKLTALASDPVTASKMTAWNRVYSIKKRLEDEIGEFFEEWMTEVSDHQTIPLDPDEFAAVITAAKAKAKARAERRIQPGQIVKEAFYDFMLSKADRGFLESFRRLQNNRYADALQSGL